MLSLTRRLALRSCSRSGWPILHLLLITMLLIRGCLVSPILILCTGRNVELLSFRRCWAACGLSVSAIRPHCMPSRTCPRSLGLLLLHLKHPLQEALLPEEELLCVAADLRRRSRRDDRGHLRPLAAIDVEAAQELRVLELGPAALRIRALALAVTLAAVSSHQGVHLSI